jgi:Tfp pilus assembly protein PilO
MNLKDPKTQITLFVVVLFLVVSYLWYTKAYSIYSAKIAVASGQCEKELAALHNYKEKAATLNDLQREFDDLQLKYQKVQLLLPERKEDESFLSQIHAAAQLTNSVVEDLTPMGAQSGDYYMTNTYAVEVESSYHGLGKFFSKVANFPFIVNISDLELKTNAGSLNASGAQKKDADKTVIATFKMLTYNVKQDAS